MPWSAPRATDSAVGRPEGDGIGPRNVTITGFRGSRGPWAPRGGPGETDSAVGRAEGDMARRPRFPLAALHAGRGAKRAEGDIPRVRPCRPRWLSRQTRRERCQGIRALACACLPCGLPRRAWRGRGRRIAGTSPSRPLAAVGSRGYRGTRRGRRIRPPKRHHHRVSRQPVPWQPAPRQPAPQQPAPGHMTFVLESCSCEKLLNLIIGFLMTRPSSSENVPSDTTINARLCTSSMP